MALSITADDNAQATLAATEIGQIMATGANVGASQVIPPTPNFASNADVVNAFKAMAAGIVRRTGAGGQPATITIVKGSPQTTAFGTAFGTPLRVVVRDSNNAPVSGVLVEYFGVNFQPASCSLSATSDTTGATGEAQVTATANGVPGTYPIFAKMTVGSNTYQVEFILTNVNNRIYYSSAYASTAQVIAGGGSTYTVVNFDVVSKDIGGGIVTGSDWKYYAPYNVGLVVPQGGLSGIFHIETSLAVTSPNSGDIVELSLWKYNSLGLPPDQMEVVLASARTTPVGGASGTWLHASAYIELSSSGVLGGTDAFRLKLRVTNASNQTLITTTSPVSQGPGKTNWIRVLKVADPTF